MLAHDYKLRETVASWEEWLNEFEHDVLPLFLKRGYSCDAALAVYTLNQVVNNTTSNDEDADWKG